MQYLDCDLTNPKLFKKGMLVDMQDPAGKTIRGYITRIITESQGKHPIKIEINGVKGSLLGVPLKSELEKEQFRFFNLFFHAKVIYLLYYKQEFLFGEETESICYLYSSQKKVEEPYRLRPVSKKYLEQLESSFFILDERVRLSQNQFKEKKKKFQSL